MSSRSRSVGSKCSPSPYHHITISFLPVPLFFVFLSTCSPITFCLFFPHTFLFFLVFLLSLLFHCLFTFLRLPFFLPSAFASLNASSSSSSSLPVCMRLRVKFQGQSIVHCLYCDLARIMCVCVCVLTQQGL